jgi:hypothetical protein
MNTQQTTTVPPFLERRRRHWQTMFARSVTRTAALLLALLTLASCGAPAPEGNRAVVAGEWHTFEGSWTATGTRLTLDMDAGHTASNVHLKGAVVLIENALGLGFRAEVIGLVDSKSGFVGRAVWTDERGDEVFSELNGEWVGGGNYIVGTFVGGTGRYAGCTGEYEFTWQYMLTPEPGVVSGRTGGFKGRARVDVPAASRAVG